MQQDTEYIVKDGFLSCKVEIFQFIQNEQRKLFDELKNLSTESEKLFGIKRHEKVYEIMRVTGQIEALKKIHTHLLKLDYPGRQ